MFNHIFSLISSCRLHKASLGGRSNLAKLFAIQVDDRSYDSDDRQAEATRRRSRESTSLL